MKKTEKERQEKRKRRNKNYQSEVLGVGNLARKLAVVGEEVEGRATVDAGDQNVEADEEVGLQVLHGELFEDERFTPPVGGDVLVVEVVGVGEGGELALEESSLGRRRHDGDCEKNQRKKSERREREIEREPISD